MMGVSTVVDDHRVAGWAAHTAGRISDSAMGAEPFAHLRFDGLLPAELFALVRKLDFSSVAMQPRTATDPRIAAERNRFYVTISPGTYRKLADSVPALALTYAVLSHPLVTEALRQRFADQLRANFGRTDVPWEPHLTLIEDRSGYALLPHTDIPAKAVTVLIYLAEDGDDVRLGTQLFWVDDETWLTNPEIMQVRVRRHLFSRVVTLDYMPNHGVAFVPSQNTFHGVAEVTGKVRRVLQYQLLVSGEVAATRRLPVRRPDATGGPQIP